MENCTRVCAVPGCLNKHKARDVCEYHYHVWRDLSAGYEEVAPFIKRLLTPFKLHSQPPCSHLVKLEAESYRKRLCKECYNAKKRECYKLRKAKNASPK